MAKENDILRTEIINEQSLKDCIYTIRGQQVMLDSDLAAIYGYSTKDFNRQVKNNIEKFPEDFYFQLTEVETNTILRWKNSTANSNMRRYNPYAFTEQGIYMLMTVLRGPVAIRQSIALIRLFKQMKDYIIENQGMLGQREYPDRSFVYKVANGIFHDRYIVTDYDTPNEKIYHCGASSKDGGNRVTTITLVTETSIYHSLIDQAMQNDVLTLN